MIQVADKVCGISGATITHIDNPAGLKPECGDIFKVDGIFKYHEPCHPKFKNQQFAIVIFEKKLPYETQVGSFAFDLRDLRKVQI